MLKKFAVVLGMLGIMAATTQTALADKAEDALEGVKIVYLMTEACGIMLKPEITKEAEDEAMVAGNWTRDEVQLVGGIMVVQLLTEGGLNGDALAIFCVQMLAMAQQNDLLIH